MVQGHALTRVGDRDPNRLPGLSVVGAVLCTGFALLLLWPVVALLRRSFSFDAISQVVGDERLRRALWFSLWQAGLATATVVVVAFPAAAVLTRYRFPGRSTVLAVAAVPFTLPTVVVGTVMLQLAPTSLRTSPFLVTVALVFFNVGYVLRALVGAWRRLDPSVEDAAATLGASRRSVVRTVVAPLLLRSLREVLAVVFVLCFTSYGLVLLLGGPRRSTIEAEIARQALDFGRFDRSAVLAVGQVLLLVAVLLRFRGRSGALSGDVRPGVVPRRVGAVAAVAVTVAAVLVSTLGPLTTLVVRSLRSVDGALGVENYRALGRVTPGSGLVGTPLAAIAQSCRTAFGVGVATTVTALALATVLVRRPNGLDGRALRVLSTLPLATSPVTLGLGVLVAFARSPMAWRTSWLMLVAVQTMVCLPFVTAILAPAVASVRTSLRAAAATLGASPWQAWRTVELGQLRRPLGISSGVAVSVALGEFGAASLLARPSSETLPVAIVRLASRPGARLAGQSAAAAVVLAVLTGVTALLAFRADRANP